MKIIDGKQIATLIDEMQVPGYYQLSFSSRIGSITRTLDPGIYFYRLKQELRVDSGKMVVIR